MFFVFNNMQKDIIISNKTSAEFMISGRIFEVVDLRDFVYEAVSYKKLIKMCDNGGMFINFFKVGDSYIVLDMDILKALNLYSNLNEIKLFYKKELNEFHLNFKRLPQFNIIFGLLSSTEVFLSIRDTVSILYLPSELSVVDFQHGSVIELKDIHKAFDVDYKIYYTITLSISLSIYDSSSLDITILLGEDYTVVDAYNLNVYSLGYHNNTSIDIIRTKRKFLGRC